MWSKWAGQVGKGTVTGSVICLDSFLFIFFYVFFFFFWQLSMLLVVDFLSIAWI